MDRLLMPTQRQGGADDVTIGELMRRLDVLQQSVDQGNRDNAARFDTLGQIYLRSDVYHLAHEGVVHRVEKLETAVEEREKEASANRRLALTGLVFPVLVLIIGALLTQVIVR